MGEMTDEKLKGLEKKIDDLDYRLRRLFDVMYAKRIPEESHDIEKHEVVEVEIGAKKIPVDKKLAPLVREMNKAGLETVECCQGREDEPRYVAIDLHRIQDVRIESGILALRWWVD